MVVFLPATGCKIRSIGDYSFRAVSKESNRRHLIRYLSRYRCPVTPTILLSQYCPINRNLGTLADLFNRQWRANYYGNGPMKNAPRRCTFDSNSAVTKAAILIVGTVAVLSAAILPIGAAKADYRLEKANLSLRSSGSPPTIIVKYYQNTKPNGQVVGWDATGKTVFFSLRADLAAKRRYYVQHHGVSVSSDWTKGRIYSKTAPKRRRRWQHDAVGKIASSRLGLNTINAISLCRRQMSNGSGGVRFFRMPITLSLRVSVGKRGNAFDTKSRSFQFNKSLSGRVQCVGIGGSRGGAAPGASRKQRFVVKGASMSVTKHNRACPRIVFVRVTLRGNKEGRARYALVRRTGQAAVRTMFVKRQGAGRYSGSFAHKFSVRRSRIISVWVRHKGKRISGLRRIRVNCSRPYKPKGVFVE